MICNLIFYIKIFIFLHKKIIAKSETYDRQLSYMMQKNSHIE